MIANILCLNYNTTKEELAKMICDKLIELNSLAPVDNREEDEIDNKADEDFVPNDAVSQITTAASRLNIPPTFSMNFCDVEDSIRSLDGTSPYSIEKWISDFDDLAKLLGWREFIHTYSQKLLTGLARFFIQSEFNINSWQ